MNKDIELRLDSSVVSGVDGIYEMIFSTGQFYIGGAKGVCRRIHAHVRGMRNGIKSQKNILSAAKESTYVFARVIEACSVDELMERETYHIESNKDKLGMLNINKPQRSASIGTKSTNTPIRVGEYSDSMILVKEWTVNEIIEHFGVHVSYIRRTLRKGHRFRGRLFYKIGEDNNPIVPIMASEKQKKEFNNERPFPLGEKVQAFNLDGTLVGTYYSRRYAAKCLNIHHSEIRKHLNGSGYKNGIKGYYLKII